MKLRSLAGSLLALALAIPTTSAWATPQIQGHQISVQGSDLQQFLGGRFPQTHDALGGLVEMTVSNPALSLPPGDRLKMAFDLALATAGGAPAPVGNVTLTSALRYDTAKQGFYLDQPTIDDFRPANTGAKLDHSTRQLLNAWAGRLRAQGADLSHRSGHRGGDGQCAGGVGRHPERPRRGEVQPEHRATGAGRCIVREIG